MSWVAFASIAKRGFFSSTSVIRQITLNKKNKVKKVELFTDHYKVEGNFYVGLEKNNLDYENHKEANNQYIAYSENKTVKMTYTLSNNTITKITLA